MSRRRRRGLVSTLAALLAASALPSAARAGAPPETGAARMPPSEYQVKAAFLYHFAQLVEWPGEGEDAAFEIAVVGDDPFGPALEKVFEGRTVHERAIRLRRYPTVQAMRHPPALLFVAESEAAESERVLRALGPAPVLTVGESDGFARRGGMIGFRVTADGRVAFDINLRRVEQSGLRMSSQLLKLANVVETP